MASPIVPRSWDAHLTRHEACSGVLTSMGDVIWCARCGEEWRGSMAPYAKWPPPGGRARDEYEARFVSCPSWRCSCCGAYIE